jgi:DNA-binding MarR family transcriptional regulator
MRKNPRKAATLKNKISALNRAPTFVIRRANQIANAAFVDACFELELTPAQYAILFALRHAGSISQNEAGRLVMLDRCTTSMVVKLLLHRDLVNRAPDPGDRRRILLSLSNAGRLLLARAENMSQRASRALLSVFDDDQATTFLQLLERFTLSHGERLGAAAQQEF